MILYYVGVHIWYPHDIDIFTHPFRDVHKRVFTCKTPFENGFLFRSVQRISMLAVPSLRN